VNPSDIGDLLILGGGLAFVLRWPAARTVRAGLTLAALTAIYVLGAIVLAGAAEGIVKIGVVWAYVLIVLRLPTLLGMPSAKDAQTDRALRSVFTPVNRALDSWRVNPGLASWTQTAEACQSALSRLDAMPAVPARWRTTLELVRRYITAVRDAAVAYDPSAPGQLPPEVTGPAFATLIQQLDEAWRSARRA